MKYQGKNNNKTTNLTCRKRSYRDGTQYTVQQWICWLMPKFHYIYLAQNLLKTRFSTSFEQKKVENQVSDKFWAEKRSETWSPTKKVANVSLPKFHYIYLAQNLLKTRFPTSFEQKKVGNLVSDKIDLSRHVKIDLAASFRQIKKSGTWSQTSFEQKKVGDLVSDLSATWSPTSRTTSRTTR